MSDDKRAPEEPGEEQEKSDREAILARRGAWVSAAVASAGVAVLGGLALAQPCLAPPPHPPPRDAGATGSPDASAHPDAAPAPAVCLRMAAPVRNPQSMPRPCLEYSSPKTHGEEHEE